MKLAHRIFLLGALCQLSWALGGCGYTTRSMIHDRFKTIHIAAFVNKIDITSDSDSANKYRIYRPGLETDVTKAVIDKFLSDGNVRPAKFESADLHMTGELVEFRRDPLRYDEDDNVIEYRLNLAVNLSLWDQKENKLLWEENNFTGDAAYYTSGTLAKSEDAAIHDALDDLARRIVERVVEQW